MPDVTLGGASFWAQSVTVTPGRRVRSIVRPGSDEPLHEDLGRAPRIVTVRGQVVGGALTQARVDLIDELETAGAKVFESPTINLPVRVLRSDIREVADKVGVFEVDLELEETSSNLPSLTLGTQPSVVVPEVLDLVALDFEAGYTPGLGDALAVVQEMIGAIADKVDSVNNKIAAALALPGGVLGEFDLLKDQLRRGSDHQRRDRSHLLHRRRCHGGKDLGREHAVASRRCALG